MYDGFELIIGRPHTKVLLCRQCLKEERILINKTGATEHVRVGYDSSFVFLQLETSLIIYY